MVSASVRARLLAVLVASAVPTAAIAQDAARPQQRLAVKAQADGRFSVETNGAPLGEVISAVAKAAGMEVSTYGALPQQSVTVSFPSSFPEAILAELMKSAGVSYVMTGGKLFMGTLASKTDGVRTLPEPVVSRASTPTPPAEKEVAAATAEPGTPPDAPEKKESQPSTGPTEWPANIAPASAPNVQLPQTREDLFREVNGSLAVTLPPDVTPNVGPVRSPNQFEPVNPPRPAAGPVGVSRPGAVPVDISMLPVNPAQANQPIPPEMLVAPKTIQVPGPVVVQFPPPKKPGQ